MSDIKITKERIDHLLNSGDVEVRTVFGKCTTVTMQLENGFILTESSACVDPANYDPELGKKLCYKHIENRLWELEGYALQKQVFEKRQERECGCDCEEEQESECSCDCEAEQESECSCDCEAEQESGDFGWALRQLRRGKTVRRRGWNGKGIFIELQVPDEHSKMSSPYIFVDTTGLQTDNEDAPRIRVPWLASQTDMLADDWEAYAQKK